MSGLTASGFERKRLADIKTDIEDALRATFGAGINLQPQSVFGQLVGVFAEREDLIWQGLEDIYNSQYPDTAFGTSLDNVVALTGTQRLPARPAVASVVITGIPGTIIPVGSLMAVPNNGPQFKTLQQLTIPAGGTLTVTVESVSTGPITAIANTINTIITPVLGWNSVNNPDDAIQGANVETDTELRRRREEQLQKAGAATLEAIRARLLTVAGVLQAICFENVTDATDGNGLPPHSIAAYVDGGIPQDIADALWQAKAGGIQTHGSIATTVTDSQGLPHTIRWSRPIEKDIYVVVNVIRNVLTFPPTGATMVRDAILGYGSLLQIGDPVIVVPAMIATLVSIPGILDADILVGTAPAPTLSDNIIQAVNEIAKFDSTRVTVNLA